MANKPLNTAILDRAIIFAVRAHTGTERRGKGFPYIVHPMEAVEIVATMTKDQELLAAAALHDTLENSNARVQNGVLADVAPTILHIMGLQQPQEMTGQCLISQSCKNLNILRISGKSPF